ncbi:MAG: hypothetical protein MUC30_01130, partial [Bacteroidales bacterium]|nr:hypothetical protein [Bacteroidales bacterium]
VDDFALAVRHFMLCSAYAINVLITEARKDQFPQLTGGTSTGFLYQFGHWLENDAKLEQLAD